MTRRMRLAVAICVIFCVVGVFGGCTKSGPSDGAVAASTPVVDKDQALAANAKIFETGVVKVKDRVYAAIGYALANSIMVTVDGGKVIVDTTESAQAAREIKAEFDKIAPGPVLAIIYTHTHPDHILGASVFRGGEDVPIWAHESAVPALNRQFAAMSDTLRYRGAHQFGENLPDEMMPTSGIGRWLRLDPGPVPPLLYPTHTFKDESVELTIGGTKFVLVHAPGETRDQIFVWLPELETLLPGDNIYQAFPNLYALRGVPPRPVAQWIDSLDKMRALAPEYLVPSHTRPLTGRDNILDVLTTYRDAIAYVHDAVIRLSNQGVPLEEMVQRIKLPPRLAGHPYLAEMYGKVSWSVRGIYTGYLGWFDGNATRMEPLAPSERAKRLLPMLGGRDKVLGAIKDALASGDAQWAAELSDVLLASDPNDADAKARKADALEALGRAEVNPNARGYYLTSAQELRGQWDAPGRPEIDSATLGDVPVEVLIKSFPARLKPEKTGDVNKTYLFDFGEDSGRWVFEIRRGVGEVRPADGDVEADLTFQATEDDFRDFLTGVLSPAAALAGGKVKVKGGLGELIAFKSYLIQP
ncbi:MAG: MBL fold metallo-hydrolase [Deltaproteobacteria bacterium]|nr:MBL fold metallo-hydrolase [Deltaproteobacteria bacterium]MCB9489924.1 MBL fold metallo-hydrolase [Deltaproteobacteria bacterium]